jgi:hypothetical protein
VVNSLGSVTTTTGGLLTSYEQKRHAGLTLSNVIGSSVRVEFRDSLQPVDGWQVLTNLTLFQSPYLFIESEAATVHPQRYFRAATFTGSPTRLGIALYNGFRFWGLPGSFCAVEYRDTPTGPWNNMTSLTLTGTPQVWFDENSGNRPRRNYRFTASP